MLALLIGAALAAAGTLMQAVFGNPLAEPSVVGVSSGAALGASASIVFGWTFLGEWTVAAAAFVAGLVATAGDLPGQPGARQDRGRDPGAHRHRVNAFAGAGLALLTFLGDTGAREQIIFWQLGSLNGARWEQVGVMRRSCSIGLVVAFLLARTLDLFSLGERGARHLGVNVELVRIVVIVVVAVLVCAAVAFAGIIAFVGLVVPHLMRMVHRSGPPPAADRERAGRRAAAAHRRPRRAHRGSDGRSAHRHAHLARRRAVLLLAAAPHAPPLEGAGR